MKQLNEYQQRDEDKASVLAEQLTEIVSHMEGWELIPRDLAKEEEYGHGTPRIRYLTTEDGKYQIGCESDQYGSAGKFEFRAAEWPKWTEDDGNVRQKHPGDCYQPNESVPETRATHGREFRTIAKQIESRLIPEYTRIYARCAEQAASAQKWSERVKDSKRRLVEATGDDRYSTGGRGTSYYVRDMAGETLVVDYNSPGDVRIRLDVDEMVAVVGFIREQRADKVTA